MKEILSRIKNNTAKASVQNKKDWYKVGKALLGGRKIKWHNEMKVGARRTYHYYSIGKGNWEGPSPRQLSKLRKNEFLELVSIRNFEFGEKFLRENSYSNEGNLAESESTAAAALA